MLRTNSFCLALSLALTVGVAQAQTSPAPQGTLAVTTASGLQYTITRAGSGAQPRNGQVLIVHYTGRFLDGAMFDSSVARQQPFAFTLGRKQVIAGWEEAFALLRIGDQATLTIPPQLAYGERQRGPIPPNSTLRFEVELLDIKPLGLADLLSDTLDAGGLEAGQRRFAELKAQQFGEAYVSETQLNALGYRLLSKDRTPEALAVLQWAIEIFPSSGNLYDSLGEVQLKAGQREAAIRSYQRSLQLEPTNNNASKVLAELGAKAP